MKKNILSLFGILLMSIIVHADGIPTVKGIQVGSAAIPLSATVPAVISPDSTSSIFNSSAITLTAPLTEIVVNLSNGNYSSSTSSLQFTFDSTILSAVPATVFSGGLYLSVQVKLADLTQDATGGGTTPYKQLLVNLTDNSGSIYAQGVFNAPKNVSTYSGYTSGSTSEGKYYYSVDTVSYFFTDEDGNKKSAKNVPISSGDKVFFQGNVAGGVPLALGQGETLKELSAGLTFKQNGKKYFSTIGVPASSMSVINTALQGLGSGETIELAITQPENSVNSATITVSKSGSSTALYTNTINPLTGVLNSKDSSGVNISSGATLVSQSIGYQTSNMNNLVMKNGAKGMIFGTSPNIQILLGANKQKASPKYTPPSVSYHSQSTRGLSGGVSFGDM